MSDRLLSESAVVEALEAKQKVLQSVPSELAMAAMAGLESAILIVRALPSALSPPEGP